LFALFKPLALDIVPRSLTTVYLTSYYLRKGCRIRTVPSTLTHKLNVIIVLNYP